MSLGAYQTLAVFVGAIQQTDVQTARSKQTTKPAGNPGTGRAAGNPDGLLLSGKSGSDTATVSRAAIVALQSTLAIDDESVIRDDDTAQTALAHSKSRILEQTEAAVLTQANQTPQQLLNLYLG